MKTDVESVNLIRARSLNHRRFQNHSAALDDAEFLKEIDHPVAHLEDDKFRVQLCVLTEIF